jgi:competence CoiA-like predicted nuclease
MTKIFERSQKFTCPTCKKQTFLRGGCAKCDKIADEKQNLADLRAEFGRKCDEYNALGAEIVQMESKIRELSKKHEQN